MASEDQAPFDQRDHLLPPHQNKPVGATIGAIIIMVLLLIGALYFWGARLNKENAAQNQVPYILPGTTTIQITR